MLDHEDQSLLRPINILIVRGPVSIWWILYLFFFFRKWKFPREYDRWRSNRDEVDTNAAELLNCTLNFSGECKFIRVFGSWNKALQISRRKYGKSTVYQPSHLSKLSYLSYKIIISRSGVFSSHRTSALLISGKSENDHSKRKNSGKKSNERQNKNKKMKERKKIPKTMSFVYTEQSAQYSVWCSFDLFYGQQKFNGKKIKQTIKYNVCVK